MENKKSKPINYNVVFHFFMTVCLTYFMTVFIDFFLIFSNIVSVSLFFLGIGALGLYFLIKKDICLIISFIFSTLCILITYYIGTF